MQNCFPQVFHNGAGLMWHGQGPANSSVAEQLRPHSVLPGTTRFVFLSARAVWELSKNQLFLSVDGPSL